MPEPADPDDDVTDLAAERLHDTKHRIIDFGYVLASLNAIEAIADPSEPPVRATDPQHVPPRRPALTDDALRRRQESP